MISDASTVSLAPWLVLAVGNPSRGDDALGPELIERLQYQDASASDVDYLIDFQLQIEHALDLTGRRAVLFVDAARPGVLDTDFAIDVMSQTTEYDSTGAAIRPVSADVSVTPATHALSAEAVLNVAQQIEGVVPPAWQLAIEGKSFDLGEGLSDQAKLHLGQAITLVKLWLDTRRSELITSGKPR